MTSRVHCSACAIVYQMPAGLRPFELSAWCSQHPYACPVDDTERASGPRELTPYTSEHALRCALVGYDDVHAAVAAAEFERESYVRTARMFEQRATEHLATLLVQRSDYPAPEFRGIRSMVRELQRWLAMRASARELQRTPVDVGERPHVDDLSIGEPEADDDGDG